jgi:hypothetical protein
MALIAFVGAVGILGLLTYGLGRLRRRWDENERDDAWME